MFQCMVSLNMYLLVNKSIMPTHTQKSPQCIWQESIFLFSLAAGPGLELRRRLTMLFLRDLEELQGQLG